MTTPSAQFPAEQAADGRFVRQPDVFRQAVTADGSSGFKAEAGRYHLYVSWACPWAHRIILVRELLGLQAVISMSAVDPVRDERGWAFRDGDGFEADPVNGFQFLSEAYHATDPAYHTRVTVPVLWDRATRRIVSNCDDDLMRDLPLAFAAFARPGAPDLYPAAHRAEIDALNAALHDRVNDGVYKAGFATRQATYERNARALFAELDQLDARLATRRWLVADHPVESDWRLFTTLVRFDAVYHGHFKCNLRRIVDYPHLSGYMRDLYQVPGVAETVKLDQIKRHYYYTHEHLNPTRVIPIGPALDFDAPPGRSHLA